MKNIGIIIILGLLLGSCTSPIQNIVSEKTPQTFVQILGIAQDAGYPQAGCQKDCCLKHYRGNLPRKMTSCIAIIDQLSETYWMIDATPDFKEQLYALQSNYPDFQFGGIFLTHAHVGHYTGLIHLGREIIGANQVPVFAMPKMADFLRDNGPWSQLVSLKNIDIIPISADSTIQLTKNLYVTPLQVPHRDEFSETVGYRVKGQNSSLLFIPDIDKWNKWDRDILSEIKNINYALLDGTFYQNGEIPGRDMALIPHPFIEESIDLFNVLNDTDRSKVQFIHFNHTNPVLDPQSTAFKSIVNDGFGIAEEGKQLPL